MFIFSVIYWLADNIDNVKSITDSTYDFIAVESRGV